MKKNENNQENSNEWKTFRLSVKRRLLRQRPELKALEKPAMQKELEELYNEQQQRYERVFKTRNRLCSSS